MKNGQLPADITTKTSDRSFIKAGAEQIPEVVEKVVKSALAKGHHIKDIQVLAPMYKGPAGIDALNKMIQQMVNPNDDRSEEHTSELQSRENLVCRLLLEKKKK